MPVGGVGSAGTGHYYGKHGFDMLTSAKSLAISPPDVAIDHLFPPCSPEKNAEIKIWFEYRPWSWSAGRDGRSTGREPITFRAFVEAHRADLTPGA
jgi:hypothetical protein